MDIIRRELFTLSSDDEGLVDVGSSDNRLNTVFLLEFFFDHGGSSISDYLWMDDIHSGRMWKTTSSISFLKISRHAFVDRSIFDTHFWKVAEGQYLRISYREHSSYTTC